MASGAWKNPGYEQMGFVVQNADDRIAPWKSSQSLIFLGRLQSDPHDSKLIRAEVVGTTYFFLMEQGVFQAKY